MIGFKSNLAFVVTYFLLSHYQRMDSLCFKSIRMQLYLSVP